MKKIPAYFLAAAAFIVMAAACAKKEAAGTYEASKRYFDAWVSLNCPTAARISDVVVLNDEPGTGAPVDDSTYVFVKYTLSNLEGDIQESTEEETHKQLGSYSFTTYYGAKPWYTVDNILEVGLERGIKGKKIYADTDVEPMRIGGKRKIIIPSWLGGTTRYDKEEDYLKNKSASDHLVYEIEIVDATKDIIRWQLDSMKRYSQLHFGGIDTVSTGFYYKQLIEPDDTHKFENDTTVYINYIGRLLNGNVFDTNIADTAKMYHLYSANRTYAPSEVQWSANEENIKLGESSVISGFAKAIGMMRSHEKGVAMFYSNLGYSANGSGSSIPAFSPLIFEIEFVEEE